MTAVHPRPVDRADVRRAAREARLEARRGIDGTTHYMENRWKRLDIIRLLELKKRRRRMPPLFFDYCRLGQHTR